MADIDDLRVGNGLQQHALHRTDKMVVESEISSKSNNRGM